MELARGANLPLDIQAAEQASRQRNLIASKLLLRRFFNDVVGQMRLVGLTPRAKLPVISASVLVVNVLPEHRMEATHAPKRQKQIVRRMMRIYLRVKAYPAVMILAITLLMKELVVMRVAPAQTGLGLRVMQLVVHLN